MAQEFFKNLFTGTEQSAQDQEQRAQQQKDQDVQMYTQVLLDPNTDPDQRSRAAAKITQLRNLDRKESPIGKLADMLNGISKHVKGAQTPSPGQATPGSNAGVVATGNALATSNEGGDVNGNTKSLPLISPLKEGFAKKALHGAERGLGGVLTALDYGLTGARQPELPVLDSSVFPTQDQIIKQKAEAISGEVDALMKQGWTREQAMEALGLKVNSERNYLRKGDLVLGSTINQPNQILYNGQPLTDSTGKLMPGVDPNGKYYPMIDTVSNATRWYPADVRDLFVNVGNLKYRVDPYNGNYYGAKGEVVGNVADLGPVNLGTRRSHEVAGVDAQGNPIAIPLAASTTPVTANRPGGASLPPLAPSAPAKPGTSPAPPPARQGASPQAKGGPRQLPGFTPGQFNTQAKGAMGVLEAAGALVGDDPQHPGGLLATLDVFNDPKKVQALSDYFTQQNQFLENEAKNSKGSVLDYVLGLPGYLSNLKTSLLADKYAALDPESRNFVDAFTRAIGTAPGLRGVTSSSSALAALRTIEREYPNPVYVKTRQNAVNRMDNLMHEINLAGSFNKLLRDKLKTLPSIDSPSTQPTANWIWNGTELVPQNAAHR